MHDTLKTGSPTIWAGLMRAKPAKPGEIYGVPGQGDSLKISTVVIVGLFFIWWLVTYTGWIKPLFLPSPTEVGNAFIEVARNGFTGASLWEHTWISTARVFGAFLLACVVGIPLGIAMGMSPVARGIFDPPIEFYRPIPPLA
ncbi:MAG: taurine ABC transporter permease, partial [Polaromonas sp.]